ncbi:MAG: hypothetical protein K8R25_06065 [Methanosarcinales archaeon]|nr:hypothetical protein [Methanosarcinales archaeon]
MSWHSIDAIDGAIQRTKHALIEPFDFWKWLKLGIITFLIGSGGGGGYNSGNKINNFGGEDNPFSSSDSVIESISQFWNQYIIFILIIVGLIICIILLFSYISSLMEFVFVESLVTNVVSFWAYSRKYLGLGFNLFVIRLILGLSFILLFIVTMLPILIPVFNTLNVHGTIDPKLILLGLLWFMPVLFVLIIASGIIGSFINLSIPLAMYRNTGIITAFSNIFNAFKSDWKQIVVYWILRFFLSLLISFVMLIIGLIFILVILIAAFTLGLILYFILSVFGQGTGDALFWMVMILFIVIVMAIALVISIFLSVPAYVFRKYYMLTFLEKWYPNVEIPFSIDVSGNY